MATQKLDGVIRACANWSVMALPLSEVGLDQISDVLGGSLGSLKDNPINMNGLRYDIRYKFPLYRIKSIFKV